MRLRVARKVWKHPSQHGRYARKTVHIAERRIQRRMQLQERLRMALVMSSLMATVRRSFTSGGAS